MASALSCSTTWLLLSALLLLLVFFSHNETLNQSQLIIESLSSTLGISFINDTRSSSNTTSTPLTNIISNTNHTISSIVHENSCNNYQAAKRVRCSIEKR